jgi:uncharacterized phage-like protein YoqJ
MFCAFLQKTVESGERRKSCEDFIRQYLQGANMVKSVSFSGHRDTNFDRELGEAGDILRARLENAIKAACDSGFSRFYSGMARGFDIIAAEAVLREKNADKPDISLFCVIPFRGQEAKWPRKWRKRHDDILRVADEIIVLNEGYITGCYHERNRYLVDNSQLLICYYSGKQGGTRHTYKYALEKGLEIVNLWDGVIL